MRSMKKPILCTLIVSIAMSYVFCILVVLSRSSGGWQGHVLNTMVTISGASLCALSCVVLWERNRKKALPLSGLAFTLVAAGLVIVVQWFDINNGAYWALTACTVALAVATSYLALVLLITKGRKRFVLLSGGLFILYNLVSGGGYLVEDTDSLASIDGVAEARLTDGAKVWLAETPTTRGLYVPFVFYYVRETYPFHLRFYGSTYDGNTFVTDEKQLIAFNQLWRFNPNYTGPRTVDQEPHFSPGTTYIVVTEVQYHRQPDDSQVTDASPVYKASSWAEIVITEPGEWIVESKGYVRDKRGETKQLTFPTMTIRPTQSGQIRIWRFIDHVVAGIMAIT